MISVKEKLLKETYDKFIDSSLKDFPLDGIEDFIDQNIMGFGTANDEKLLSIAGYRELILRQREQGKDIEMAFDITPVLHRITGNGDSALFVDEVTIKMLVNNETLQLVMRLSSVLEYREDKWFAVHFHGSLPGEAEGETDTWHIDEWKQKNAKLEKMVAEKTADLEIKNRELEIETALEKVRSSALAMKQPEDMVEVCHVISDQLQLLGVNDIRNVQTAIIDESKGTFLNYEYFSAYNKGTIEKTKYKKNAHPKVLEIIQQMKKPAGTFFSGRLDGESLDSFRTYRKQEEQFADPELDKTSSMDYYFYPIGQGGLGLTTYKSLPKSGLDIFKRFHKVFSLAFRRFLDIEQAMVQAREAKIETALERVRSRSMAMHSSDELVDASDVMFNELKKLEIETLRIGICTIDGKTGSAEIWSRSEIKGKVKNTILGVVPAGLHPIFDNMVKAWKEKKPFFSSERVGDEVRKYYEKLATCLSYPKRKEYKKRESMTAFFFAQGSLNVISLKPLNEEECQILIRFAKVFGQMYTRFLDLQKAEAQTREAQIEAALERVRSKTIGMQRSDELKDAAMLMFQQVEVLGVPVFGCGFNIWDDDRKATTAWMAGKDRLQPPFKTSSSEDIFLRIYDAAQREESLFVEEQTGAELLNHYKYLSSIPVFKKILDQLAEKGLSVPSYQIMHCAFFSQGYLMFITFEPTSNAYDIFERFAGVFEQTYTRFLDLQKAEAQAREARIETALERVRSRTMAMQKSDELPEAANLLFQQVQDLGIPVWSAGYSVWDEDKLGVTQWMSSEGVLQPPFRAPLTEDPTLIHFLEAHQRRESFFVEEIGGEDLVTHYNYMRTLPVVGEIINKIADAGFSLPTFQINHVAYFSQGFLLFITYEPIPDAWKTFIRFANVFEQTYTRFLDLQNAEAQNKIIQAENDRKTKELEEARQLQLSMLPKELPQLPHLDIAVYMQTATEVGGDYYDFSTQPDGSLNIAIGDATGHGMKAGIMVSSMKSIFTTNSNKMDIESFFVTANSGIKSMKLPRMMMGFAMLNIQQKKLKLINGAMPPIYIYRKKSHLLEEIAKHGMPIGAMMQSQYSVHEELLEDGDVILLMSDGLPELSNKDGEMYGYKRICDGFTKVAEQTPEKIIDYLKTEGSNWVNGEDPDDDVTFVVLKMK